MKTLFKVHMVTFQK